MLPDVDDPPRLFTIGYQRLAPARLDALLEALDARLVDVRAHPSSRIPGWSLPNLRARLGARYPWKGDLLGGGPHVTPDRDPASIWPAGLSWLRDEPGRSC